MTNRLTVLFLLFTSFFFSSVAYSVYSKPPQSVEDFLYTTMHIVCKTPKNYQEGTYTQGTGFIYEFKDKYGPNSPYLVTNKHVIENAITGDLVFNYSQDNIHPIGFHPMPGFGNSETPFCNWFFHHSSREVDLCALPLAPFISIAEEELSRDRPIQNKEPKAKFKTMRAQLREQTTTSGFTPFELKGEFASFSPLPTTQPKKMVFYRSLSRNNLVNESYESPIQDILMVGYPIGIFDDSNNLPIVRKGITSSHINKRFQGLDEVLIDAACFPGSSGSPVFLSDGIKGTFYAGAYFKPTLLGIFYATPRNSVHGKLEYKANKIVREFAPTSIPTPISQIDSVITNIPPHLGFVIKGNALDDIQNVILKHYKITENDNSR